MSKRRRIVIATNRLTYYGQVSEDRSFDELSCLIVRLWSGELRLPSRIRHRLMRKFFQRVQALIQLSNMLDDN